ncbi:oligopeptide transporter [Linderina pennispora]|uniref:Oligopeptide transporter n=1 Tax=Linderina pennispora TaxID=61395 RepID=A0A1Y1W3C5_9FUNG|nr:oligopeptide transporter [Linderina pennispora]ORX68030.1 oligopeptide transporter [Linderina pennispora]
MWGEALKRSRQCRGFYLVFSDNTLPYRYHFSVIVGLEKDSQFNEEEEDEDSPFEIVRIAVSNKDNPDLPSMTFPHLFYWFRQNQLTLGASVVQIISFPCGYLMAKVLPTKVFSTFGWKWTLNPGPFNIKEHVLLTITATACATSAYAIDVVTIKKMWYESDLGFGASLLFLMTSQLLGYSFAGLSRRFLVYPSAMLWPTTLVTATLFRTFHETTNWGKLSRTKVFWIAFAASFAWYFVPGFAMPLLTAIPILYSGLGMLNLTLDWSTIASYMGSPISYPFPMACNLFVGFVIMAWIATPAGYYANTWDTGLYPIYTAGLFLPNGSKYNIKKIMTPHQTLDPVKYAEYGPLRMTYMFGYTYGVGFAAIMALLVYVGLHYGKDIVRRFRQSRTMDEDIHMKLMRNYEEVPQWWYLATFVATFSVSIVTCEVFHLMNWYWMVLATVIPFIFTIPIGIIQAISNQQPGLNIITEFIIGYGKAGDPVANVTFKVYGYITMTQALNLVSDQKLGHYMKIPPRHMFIQQMVGTILAGLVQLLVAYWLMNSIDNMCTPEGYPWTCRSANTFYSASVIWGLVGPGRMFGGDSPYHTALYLFILGVLIPIPFWYLYKRYPNSIWKHVHIPVIMSISGSMPPMPTGTLVNWFIGACFLVALWQKLYRVAWQRYAFATSAGLDSGLAISGIVIFFAFQNVVVPAYWGNKEDYLTTAARQKSIASGDYLGIR